MRDEAQLRNEVTFCGAEPSLCFFNPFRFVFCGRWIQLMPRLATSGMTEEHKTESKFAKPQNEPLFTAVSQTDPAFQIAYDQALATVPAFIKRLESRTTPFCLAKLRFRDPDESERLGENRFLFLWLSDVYYHREEHVFSGTFFEVPPEFQKWHQVGARLTFDPDDIFDWMIIENAHLHGGFTLRVTRDKLPESERDSYDQFVGVSVYEPLPL